MLQQPAEEGSSERSVVFEKSASGAVDWKRARFVQAANTSIILSQRIVGEDAY